MLRRVLLCALAMLAASIIACSGGHSGNGLPPAELPADARATLMPDLIPAAGTGVAMNIKGTNDPDAPNCLEAPGLYYDLCYVFNPGDTLKTTITITGVQSTVYCGLYSFCCPNPIPTITWPTGAGNQGLSGATVSFSPPTYTPPQCGPWVTRTTITMAWDPPSPWPSPNPARTDLDNPSFGASGCCLPNINTDAPTLHNAASYFLLGRFDHPHPSQTPQPSPTPGVDIYDFNVNKVVTATTQSVIVGTQQNLGVVAAQPGATLSNCNWTIAGNTVAGYNPTGATPSPVATSNAQQVQFYWIGIGANVTVTSYGVSVAAKIS